MMMMTIVSSQALFNLYRNYSNNFFFPRYLGSIAIPGACIGIFIGGCLLKRFQIRPKGAVQFVLISNLACLACYGLLFFLGCDNLKMAGTTIPYYNRLAKNIFKKNQIIKFKQKNKISAQLTHH